MIELRQEFPKYPLIHWLKVAALPKSSYYEWVKKLKQVNQEEEELIVEIRKIIDGADGRYGYRRVTVALNHERMIKINQKRVLRIMRENNLLCIKFSHKSRKYSSYKGKIGKVVGNQLNRAFEVERENTVWLSDVTEFSIPNEDKKLYLSAVLDLYNSEIVGYSLNTSPTTQFTNESLDKALNNLPSQHQLMVHTDQGFHYQHQSWRERLESHQIEQSMSRKGNCLDNSPMENFFGILKQEMFNGERFESIAELTKSIHQYINWYNQARIKLKLNGLSPVQYRLQAA